MLVLRSVYAVWFLFIGSLLLTGCSSNTPVEGRIDNITQVFMHSPEHYSVQFRDKDELKLHDFGNKKVVIKTDVPADKPMWAEYKGYIDGKCNNLVHKEITIHVHESILINGAGWDTGKDRGQTTPIINVK